MISEQCKRNSMENSPFLANGTRITGYSYGKSTHQPILPPYAKINWK
jgi:hypothetical protein